MIICLYVTFWHSFCLKNKLRVFLNIGTAKTPHDLGGRKILRQFQYDLQPSLKTNLKGKRNEND